MASKKKNHKRRGKKGFSTKESQAYWVGVGISARVHSDVDKIFESKDPKIQKSVLAGYNADKTKNVSRKFHK